MTGKDPENYAPVRTECKPLKFKLATLISVLYYSPDRITRRRLEIFVKNTLEISLGFGSLDLFLMTDNPEQRNATSGRVLIVSDRSISCISLVSLRQTVRTCCKSGNNTFSCYFDQISRPRIPLTAAIHETDLSSIISISFRSAN